MDGFFCIFVMISKTLVAYMKQSHIRLSPSGQDPSHPNQPLQLQISDFDVFFSIHLVRCS